MQDREIDSIYNYFDFLLQKRRFKFIDRILRNIEISGRDVDELISYLTVTLPAKSNLIYRKTFYKKVCLVVDKNLLEGLE